MGMAHATSKETTDYRPNSLCAYTTRIVQNTLNMILFVFNHP